MLTQVRVTMIPGALLLQAPGIPLRAAISAVYTQPAATSVWGDDFAAWHGDVTVDAWFQQFLGQPCQLLFIGEAPAAPANHPGRAAGLCRWLPLSAGWRGARWPT